MKAHFPLSLYGQKRQRTRLAWVHCCFPWLTAALAEPHNKEKAMCLCISFVNQDSVCSVVLPGLLIPVLTQRQTWHACMCVLIMVLRVLCCVVFYPVWAAHCVMTSFPLNRWLIFTQQEARGFCWWLLSAGGEAHATALLCAWSCPRGTISWEVGPSAAAGWKWQVSWVRKVVSTEAGHLHKVFMRNARVTPQRVGRYLPENISSWRGRGTVMLWTSQCLLFLELSTGSIKD